MQAAPRRSQALWLSSLIVIFGTLQGCVTLGGGGTPKPGPNPLVIATVSPLTGGRVGRTYSTVLNASGGAAPYKWGVRGGVLPPGLVLSSLGQITGSPSTIGSFDFTAEVSDSAARAVAGAFNVSIGPPELVISTSSLPSGSVGAPYSATLTGSGGTSPYTWTVSAGTLPAGLSLNASNGAITGTPTAAISATPLTFKLTDSESPADATTVTLALTIAPATLQITSTSLPNGQVGTSYTATLAAGGGVTPYTWALANGTLPAGLSLNAATGGISGTPTATSNTSPLTFKVSDSESPSISATVTLPLTIAAVAPALQITTSSLQNGQVGTAYSATLAASGGVTPYTWALVSGTLPAGLSLNAATAGVIGGTPTASSNATSLTFRVTDSASPAASATATLSLTIAAAPTPPLQITTSSVPNGQVGGAYTATLAATGGVTPYTWALASGTLPAGLSLNAATGVISGTPTASSNATSLTFKVTDSASPAASATTTLSLTIAGPALQITTSSLPNGQVGTAYSATLAATGGTSPYTWTLASGTLPAGLSLNAGTGVISGTPTASSTGTSLTFKVTDSASPAASATATFALTVTGPALQITTTSLPDGQVGTAYSATLAATGGASPYTWTLAGGTLPAGLSLNSATGVISGTPTASSSATSRTFKVTDSASPAASATATLSLTIAGPTLTITTTSLPDGVVGAAYSATLAASGGTAPYSWTLTSGTLPAGLSLNASTGAVSGTPTAASNAVALAFKVTDSNTPASSQTSSLALTIASSSNAAVAIVPTVATVNFTQTQQFAATVTGTTNTSVNWYVDNIAGGSAAVGTISPAGLYTPPAAVRSHKVTAISAVNSNATADATLYVSNSPGVLSYHNDNLRTGLNSAETVLTPSNVNSTQFGKLFSWPVDGQIFGQPLYVPSLTIGSQVHNVIFVATEHDSVYAWDATSGSQTPLWQTSCINPAAGITAVPCAEALNDCVTVYPEFGITSTPVIDSASGTLYVVAETKEAAGNTTNYVYLLHALSLSTGAEKFGGPVVIQGNFSGVAFDPLPHIQRAGLLLANGVVYVAFASHGDTSPWHGWVLSYNASSLQQVMGFNTAPPA